MTELFSNVCEDPDGLAQNWTWTWVAAGSKPPLEQIIGPIVSNKGPINVHIIIMYQNPQPLDQKHPTSRTHARTLLKKTKQTKIPRTGKAAPTFIKSKGDN